MINKKKYDNKCEVYSLGILLWEIAECKTPCSQFEDFTEITNKVIEGYRKLFTPGTDIPNKYQELVQDIFKNYGNPTSQTDSLIIRRKPPLRKDSDLLIDWSSFNYLTIEKAAEEHKRISADKNTDKNTDKSTLYKCFDAYASMGNPKAKYYKAYYYISEGCSDLKIPDKERYGITAKLYKEAADHGDDFLEAQLYYALMAIHGKGVEKIWIKRLNIFLKLLIMTMLWLCLMWLLIISQMVIMNW